MLIAIDTSTAQVGLALYDGNQVLGEMTWTTRQHHTTELAPALTGLLNRSGVSMDMDWLLRRGWMDGLDERGRR